MPRLNGRLTTAAPAASARAAVTSSEPSSMTTTSRQGSKARSSATTLPTASSSFRAGTIARRRSGPGCSDTGGSGTRTCPDAEPDEVEQLPRAMSVRVLVEDALPRPRPHRLGLRRIVEQASVRSERLIRVVDDQELLARLEPPLDPLVRVRDDRRASARQLEGPAGGRGRYRRVRAPCDVEVDPRGGDRLVEGVEGDIADEPRPAGVALEVAAAQGELDLRRSAAWLPDHRSHPLAAELVPVAVEEDVVHLLDRLRREELGIGAPEDGLGPLRAELEQARQPAFGVGDDEVVFGRVGAVVVVEARIHAAELGQAHRN